jgi:hypothetical protein
MNDAYLRRCRRMLLDMHIPDWDAGLLARHDPEELARCYEGANVNAVMLSCKSHVGLTYWPTSAGKRHAAIGGDAVGEMVRLLHERDILVCGYDSVAYDTHAVLTHPSWSVVPAQQSDGGPAVSTHPRHSVVCMNKRGYLEYEKALLSELLPTYPFDAFFLDMAFWPSVCVCEDCRGRLRDEDGQEVPDHIDWESPAWARFQAARERWADGFMLELLAHVRGLADIPVYQNFAVTFAGWIGGKPVRSFRNDTFLGADLTGGRDQQLFATKLMRAASPQLPAEYMASRAPSLMDHVSVKSETEMTLQALGAVALGSAVLFIDAIDPDGRVDPDVYEQIGRVYRRIEPYEGLMGGEHIEDVGVYFSSDASVDLRRNGAAIGGSPWSESDHLASAIGATRLLQRAHVAAGVATDRQLEDLSRYPVLIVPELSRITEREAERFRAYVESGGHLYASGRTSLLGADGTRHADFLLADVFGVHFEHEETGPYLFVRPADPEVAEAIAPQKHLGWALASAYAAAREGVPAGPPRITADHSASALATLSLAYDDPEFGTAGNRSWASVYGIPPWTHTSFPTVVEHAFGAGRAIYSVLPLERDAIPAAGALFVSLVRRLLGRRASIEAECHPAVWLEAFHQPDRRRFVVNLLNFPDDLHPIPADVAFLLTLPEGAGDIRVRRGPAADPIPFERNDGAVGVEVHLELFDAVVIEYEGAT